MKRTLGRAAKARSLISRGEPKADTAKALGYKSVAGMMGAITAYEHALEAGKFRKRKKQPMEILDMPSAEGIRVDAAGEDGEYIRLEGKHIVASFIAYRGSINIGAKANPGYLRLYECTLGNKREVIAALKEVQTIAGMLTAMMEGRGYEKNKGQ